MDNMKYDAEWLNKVANEHGIKISSGSKFVDGILNGLNKTEGFCPCVPRHLHGENTICPCKSMREDGHCHCGLFDCKEDTKGADTNE